MKTLHVVVLACLGGLQLVCGHGFLWEPPSRSSMWRHGFNVPANYDHMGLNCGGFDNQWNVHGGKCGICGDPEQGPRQNEAGGKYAMGIISRSYSEGQVIDVTINITTYHKGWSEFRICPNNNVMAAATQTCLDRHLLLMADGSGTRFPLPSTGSHTVTLKLPHGLTCQQCVLQWKWNAGNNWGTDPDGTSCVGCGPQEQFYGCADVRIDGAKSSGEDEGHPEPESTPTPPTGGDDEESQFPGDDEHNRPEDGETEDDEHNQPEASEDICWAVGPWDGDHSMSQWCIANCLAGFCPADRCRCREDPEPPTVSPSSRIVCRSAGFFRGKPKMDEWCVVNCGQGYCPRTHCLCGPEDRHPNTPATTTPAHVTISPSSPGSCTTFVAVGRFTGDGAMDAFCQMSCPFGMCSERFCACDETRPGFHGMHCAPREEYAEVPNFAQYCMTSCLTGMCPGCICQVP